jgi:hypothetical protein
MGKRITIPSSGPGRRHVKAEIVEHVAAFVELHRGYKVTQSKTTDWKSRGASCAIRAGNT